MRRRLLTAGVACALVIGMSGCDPNRDASPAPSWSSLLPEDVQQAVRTDDTSPPPLPPCKTEDSQSCIWAARIMGNGPERIHKGLDPGRSFWASKKDGEKFYVSHQSAETAIARWCVNNC